MNIEQQEQLNNHFLGKEGVTKITIARAWEKSEAKRVEPLEILRNQNVYKAFYEPHPYYTAASGATLLTFKLMLKQPLN